MDCTKSTKNGAVGIIGPPREMHVAAMRALLEARGVPAQVIDTQEFPGAHVARVGIDGASWDGVDLGDLRSCYIRLLMANPIVDDKSDAAMKENWYAAMMAYREKGATLAGVVGSLRCPVVNRETPASTHKPVQLRAFRDAGIPVPRTLITNDPEAVRAFTAEVGRVVYKPVTGGATVRPLEPKDLVPERLEKLRNAPVNFQEFIPGDNIRAYVVDDRVVAAAVLHTTDEYDFRRAEGEAEVIDLPPDVREQCVQAAKASGLVFTGIDIKRDGRRHVFLEANPSPMWLGFDRKTGGGVGDALADYLANPK